MAKCEVCGNDYYLSFEVVTSGRARHTFDSFECAIHKLAPVCDHCGCKIIGHGIEANNARGDSGGSECIPAGPRRLMNTIKCRVKIVDVQLSENDQPAPLT